MKKYFVLHPADFKLDGGAMFGIIPKPLWSKAIAADELNRIQLSLRIMLIQTANRNILIDTGIGDYHGAKFDERFGVNGPEDPLLAVLKKNHGLESNDITDLILSHLHFDHVGGLGHKDGEFKSVFPNATLHIHKEHYAYSLNPTMRDTGSFQSEYFRPLIEEANSRGKVNWISGEDGIILSDNKDEIKFKCSHGHTPFLMHPYDEKFIYMADLVPTSAHISVPWVMGYDISPGITTLDKLAFYEFIVKNDLTMIFEHDMLFWGAKVSRKGESDFQAQAKYPVTQIDPLKSELFFD